MKRFLCRFFVITKHFERGKWKKRVDESDCESARKKNEQEWRMKIKFSVHKKFLTISLLPPLSYRKSVLVLTFHFYRKKSVGHCESREKEVNGFKVILKILFVTLSRSIFMLPVRVPYGQTKIVSERNFPLIESHMWSDKNNAKKSIDRR